MSAGGAVVADLAVEVERDEVLRCLGYRSQGRLAAAGSVRRVHAALDRLWPEALSLLSPRGAWRVVAAAAARAAGMPDPAPAPTGGPDPGPSAGIGVCTVGSRLEAASAARAAAGSLLDALVLDAIGSAAAEAAADAVNLALCAEARSRGLFATARVSPGYGSWDVACQARLLALLPIEAVGVSLTSGQMMSPRKSVSFAVSFAAAPEDASANPCERCGLTRCRHRVEQGGR